MPELEIGRSDRMVIRPAFPEWEERGEDYEELVETLRSRGLDAEIAEIKAIPSGADLPEFIPIAVIVYLGGKVADALVEMLVNELKRLIIDRAKTRWWRKGQRVKAVIYGPKGEVLRELTWEAREGRKEDRQP